MVVNCIMYHHTKCYVLYVLQLTLYSNKGLKSSTVVLLLPIPKQGYIMFYSRDEKNQSIVLPSLTTPFFEFISTCHHLLAMLPSKWRYALCPVISILRGGGGGGGGRLQNENALIY